MHTITLLLLVVIAWSLWPLAHAFLTADGFPVGWPYGGDDGAGEDDVGGAKSARGQVVCKGGSAPKPPDEKEQELPEVPTPQPLPPPPPPPPPPTEDMSEVDQAKADVKRKAVRSQGLRSTLLAGETGGFRQQSTTDGSKKTLLG